MDYFFSYFPPPKDVSLIGLLDFIIQFNFIALNLS